MARDYLDMLCSIGELSSLLNGSSDSNAFMQGLVDMVAEHLRSDVCSIYMYRSESKSLELRATRGLSFDAVGRVTMKEGEGLIGHSMKELRPILDNQASTNPHYRYFPEVGEDQFECFLAVPIQRGTHKIGVLAVQRFTKHDYKEIDARALKAVAAQLAGPLENASALLEAEQEESFGKKNKPLYDFKGMQLLRGEPSSGGSAVGRLRRLDRGDNHLQFLADQVPGNTGEADLKLAIKNAVGRLEKMQDEISVCMPEMATLIFSAHVLMLKDTSFSGAMIQAAAAGASAGQAVLQVAHRFVDLFAGSSQAFMREKAEDVQDIAQRIFDELIPSSKLEKNGSDTCCSVIVADQILPSDVIRLSAEGVGGLILSGGGVTSHVAIIARALTVPLIFSNDAMLQELPEGLSVLMDGSTGNIYLCPTQEVIERYEMEAQARLSAGKLKEQVLDKTYLASGERVTLMANINLLSEVSTALTLKAEGVGLYRTEFPFMIRKSFPSEDEQYNVYQKLIEKMPGREITIRTLDVGGEKALAYYDHGEELNPELGLRSVRFSLAHLDLFEAQIRAILRAGADADQLRIMFPLIGSPDEMAQASEMVKMCCADLSAEGLEHYAKPQLGMMIELPSVLELIDDYAQFVDFFSIGTNDFVQYLLGVDRANERVAAFYCPHHPAVLRALKRIAVAAAKHDCDLSICGEMAHDAKYLPFLLGIGIRKFSLDPHYIPELQSKMYAWSLAALQQHADALLETKSIAEAGALIDLAPFANMGQNLSN